MNEQKVLASCLQDRAAYERIRDHIAKGDFTDQGSHIFGAIESFYQLDANARKADGELVVNRIVENLGTDKHRDTFDRSVRELGALEVSPANIVYDFLAVRREAIGNRLVDAILNKDDKAAALLDEYERACNATDFEEESTQEVLCGADLDVLLRRYDSDHLIRVWPASLTKRLDGGVIRGHHIVLFAQPEVGKTLFVINAIAGFLQQDLRVLYIGNEEPVHDVNMRVITRLARVKTTDVAEHHIDAQEVVQSERYKNLVLVPASPGTPGHIRELIGMYGPDVVIIDQLRNIRVKGANSSNKTSQLEAAATEARNIAKDFDVLVLSVTQAGDSASNKSVLSMGDVADSNTGIPAQCDILIGFGKGPDDGDRRRTITLCKNKRNGNHDNWPVKLEPEYSRIEDYG